MKAAKLRPPKIAVQAGEGPWFRLLDDLTIAAKTYRPFQMLCQSETCMERTPIIWEVAPVMDRTFWVAELAPSRLTWVIGNDYVSVFYYVGKCSRCGTGYWWRWPGVVRTRR